MVNLYCLFYYINYSNDNEAYIVLYQYINDLWGAAR